MATSTTKPAGAPAKKDGAKDAPAAAKPAGNPPASGDKRMMAMIAAFAILSAGASAGAVYMVTRTQISALPAGHAAGPVREFPGPTYSLGDFIVNLGNADSRRFLKASVALGFHAHNEDFQKLKGEARTEYMAEFESQMKLREAQTKDIINSTISSFSASELGTIQGKQKLKQTLVAKLDRLMPPEYNIADVYFPEFIIQ